MTQNPNKPLPVLSRQVFPSAAEHAALLRLLLAQDGSATRLCEALAGQPVDVLLHHQTRTQDVPAAVREHLGGNAWLQRVTTLSARGVVLMDNLSFTRLDAVPDWFLAGLDAGKAPIGHLLDKLHILREDLPQSAELAALFSTYLWPHVGLPDERAAKVYRIDTPASPLMLVLETFRSGWVELSPV